MRNSEFSKRPRRAGRCAGFFFVFFCILACQACTLPAPFAADGGRSERSAAAADLLLKAESGEDAAAGIAYFVAQQGGVVGVVGIAALAILAFARKKEKKERSDDVSAGE